MGARKIKPFITEYGQLILPWISRPKADAYVIVLYGRVMKVCRTHDEAKAWARRLKVRPAWLYRKLGRMKEGV